MTAFVWEWLVWAWSLLPAAGLALFQLAAYVHSGWTLLRRLRLDDRRLDAARRERCGKETVKVGRAA